jgi:uncharacterized membrane protein/3-hydroxymyristoyl/3-hydroxydecanoyl-(acyl carrier protein) dehydratase
MLLHGKSRGALSIAAKLAYPLVILGAWHWDAPRYAGCMLLVLPWLQRWGGTGAVAAWLRRLTAVDWCIVAVLTGTSVAIVLTNSELLLRLYPSLVNLGLLAAFGATLARGPSMVEKFARLHNPDPSPQVVRYTRRVTQLWCVFFTLNSAFSIYTALCWRREAWSLYNGALAYGVIGVLLVTEIAWRRFVMLPRAAFAASLQPRADGVEILAESRRGDQFCYELHVPHTLVHFAGHFPGLPILPGVVQVDWAVRLAAAKVPAASNVASIDRLKFLAPVPPGALLELILAHDPSRQRIQFTYRLGQRNCASGVIVYREPG